jgi:hypothetical protein
VQGPPGNLGGRFYENGKYIGHDEPSVRFISDQPGSGNDVTFTERLPLEPNALPTVGHPGSDVTHTFELSIAPWFSIDVCDPQSAPQNPCAPESDANAPNGNYPGAGAAFVELQYPLVLGAQHRQPGMHGQRFMQPELHRAGQRGLHPDQQRAHRAAQPAAQRPGLVHA